MKLLDNIQILQTLNSPYPIKNGYFNFHCGANNTIWIQGRDHWTVEVDRNGVVQRRFRQNDGVRALCISSTGDAVFLTTFSSPKVYLLKDRNVEVLLKLNGWRPRGLCFGENSYLFVSMRKTDLSESKVVRYKEGEANKEYQFDGEGNNLYSISTKHLMNLCQNRNGDICVVDTNAVVVVNVEGMLKFVYRGNPSLPNGQFMPRDIATDIHGLIMTNDFCNHSVHIFDCDGNFLRFIQSPTGDGGLGFDADNNLVLGDKTGELYIIRYWE